MTDGHCDDCKHYRADKCEKWRCEFEPKGGERGMTRDSEPCKEIKSLEELVECETISVTDAIARAYKDGFMVGKYERDTETRGDCLSREAVLKLQYKIDDSATLSSRDVVDVDEIEALPPVTPTREHGEWNLVSINDMALKIYRCSVCGNKTYGSTNFCPNCGADMKGEQNDI